MRILIIEDEKEIADGIEVILTQSGYQTDSVYDGISGLDYIQSGLYDLVLLDIMLPGMDGIKILERIRKDGIKIPVILLTARSQVDDRIKGLDAGADDYLTKPFDAGELLARIRARIRNLTDVSDGCLVAYDIKLDSSTYKVSKDNKAVKLSKTEYLLLEYLIMNKGHVLTKDMIMSKVWGDDNQSEYNSLEVYISFLRKKLHFINATATIVTKKGIGYSMEDNV